METAGGDHVSSLSEERTYEENKQEDEREILLIKRSSKSKGGY